MVSPLVAWQLVSQTPFVCYIARFQVRNKRPYHTVAPRDIHPHKRKSRYLSQVSEFLSAR